MPMLLALPFPVIDPVAISIGPIAIRWYALAYVAGLLAGWWLARRYVERPDLWAGSPPTSAAGLDDLLVHMALGVVLGGRAGYVLFYNLPFFVANPWEIPQVWHGGMSFHGGLAGATGAAALFALRRGASVLSTLDLVAAVAPIGSFFGRIANFVNGELWGRVSDVPWAMVFPHGGPLPRHPSQLYQAGLEGALLFVAVTLVASRGGFRRPGLVAGVFGAGYGLARIAGEFFREPDAQLGYLVGGWLTMGMVLSLPMLAIGLALILWSRRQLRHDPA